MIDEHDGTVLPFATALVEGTTIGAIADDNGSFTIKDLCPGRMELKVSHIGCEPQYVSLELKSDTTIRVILEHHSELLRAVEIETKKPHKDISGRQTLAEETINKMQPLPFAQVMASIEGVQTLNSSGNISKPMIHGLTGNRIVIQSDGVAIEGQQWGAEHAPEIDPFAMENAEVVFGASALRYGPDALAGAVIANGVPDTAHALHGWFHSGYSTNGGRAVVAGRLKGGITKRLPLFFGIQGTFGRGGDLKAPDYYLDNTGSSDRHLNTSLAWSTDRFHTEIRYKQFNTDLGILSYAHIGNLSDLEQILENGEPINPSSSFSYDIRRPFQHIEHETWSAKGFWKPKLESRIEWTLSRQYNLREEYDNSTFSGEAPDLQYELTTYSGQLEAQHRLSSRFKSELGVSGQIQANTIEGRFFIPNYRRYKGGVFFINHYQLKRLELEAGIRYDYQYQQAFMFRNGELYEPIRRFDGLSWNAGVSYDAGAITISSNVAQGWRPPAINELYSSGLHHGAAAIEYGDESLSEEQVWSWQGQLDAPAVYLLGAEWNGMLRVHTSFYQDFIYLVPDGEPELTIRGAFPVFRYESVDAWFRGIDTRISAQYFDQLTLSLQGELIRANNVQTNEYLFLMPQDQLRASVRWDLPWTKFNPYLSGDVLMASKQIRAPKDEDFAPPPPGYYLFGAEVGGRIAIGSRTGAIWSIRVDNMLDASYRSYTNRLRYYADEPGRNVSFTLRIPLSTPPPSAIPILEE